MVDSKESKVEVPEAPQLLPEKQQEEWKKAYAAAFKEAQAEFQDDLPAQKQHSVREANRLLRVPEIKSYDDAQKLEKWQFLRRAVENGQLKVVTIDGKKYSFPVAKKSA